MKKHAALAALALTLPLAACNDDTSAASDPVTIDIEEQDWTDWTSQKMEPNTHTVEVGEGDTFEVTALGDPVTIEVVEIGEDQIEIETSAQLAPEGETGGVNMNEADDDFTLERGESTRLSTPSEDGGTHITFTVS